MTTDLTDAVLEAMLGGHTQGSSMGDPYCRECMTDWPCDLVRVVTALRSLRSWADGARADLGAMTTDPRVEADEYAVVVHLAGDPYLLDLDKTALFEAVADVAHEWGEGAGSRLTVDCAGLPFAELGRVYGDDADLRERLAQKVETQSCGSDCYERAARIIRGTGATT